MGGKIMFVGVFAFLLLSSLSLAAVGDASRYNTKTVTLYLNSTGPQLAAGTWNNFTATLSLPDPSTTILSAFLRISGTWATTGATADEVQVWLNNTLIGDHTITPFGEVSAFEFIVNATGTSGADFYAITSADKNFQVSLKCLTIPCNLLSTEAIITYKYDPPAPPPQKDSVVEIPKEKNIFENLSENFSRMINYLAKIFGG